MYSSSDAGKPPVGEGLNVACEVTLYNVFKPSKQAGQPTKCAWARMDAAHVLMHTPSQLFSSNISQQQLCPPQLAFVAARRDPAALSAFERRLRRYCADTDARHILYRAEGGVWTFQVS